jgi:hypothetical protein
MKIKSNLVKRIAIWKAIWLVFWWIAFLLIPSIFGDADLFLRFWVWLWYITLWALIWIFWVMNYNPLLKISMPYWGRWILLWWWMNFVLVLFIHDKLISLMQNSILQWYSPFWLIIEWMIFWLITDYFATKYIWEWKDLLKEKK